MAVKTYSGACHCGAVRYTADIDLNTGTTRCNCSICYKQRAWFAIVKADQFRLERGGEVLSDYQWTPPHREEPNLHYRFCRTCGIRAFAQGDHESMGGVFYAVAVATLEDADPDELAETIHYVDGRNDRYDRQPENTRLM